MTSTIAISTKVNRFSVISCRLKADAFHENLQGVAV